MNTTTTSQQVALHDVSSIGKDSSDRMLARPRIPFTRLTRIELRKMFNTRSGFWLMMSIAILAALATAVVLIFAPDEAIDYETFSTAIGMPMSVLLPVIGILAVTSEWSQRSGLTTFTLVPTRGRIIAAKLVATVLVGIVSMLVAMGVGALGNLLGATLRGVDLTWGMDAADVGKVLLANVLGMLMGFVLGALIRHSAGALVAFFAWSFVLPTITGILMGTQQWWRDINRWVDFQGNMYRLFDGPMAAADWGYLGLTSIFWLVIPLAIGTRMAIRSEVK